MLTPADFIRIPYHYDLTQAGILYACRALVGEVVQPGHLDLDPLREMVVDVATALAFRRCLAENHIPYRTLEVAPFSQPGLEQVILSGCGCHLINRNLGSRSWTDDLTSLCSAPASLAKAQFDSDRLGPADLLIFTYILLQPNTRQREHDQSNDFVYVFPAAWRNPRQPGSITPCRLSFESTQRLILEIGGLGMDGQIQTEDLQLTAHQRTSTGKDFSALAYMVTQNLPSGLLSVQHGEPGKVLRISPDRWKKLGLDWKEIILAGYMTVRDFRRRARRIRSASHLFPELSLPLQAVYLQVGELQTMRQLFAWVKEQPY